MPLFRRRRDRPTGPGLSDSDLVWNRATLERGGDNPREGDLALAAMLSLHSVAMNGGLLHSVEHHDAGEIQQGVAGYRYFGLDGAAAVVEWVAEEAAGRNRDDELDAAEQLEGEADERYAAVVSDDSTLVSAFDGVFRSHPEAFAPL